METVITEEYLDGHPNDIFVFGDNTIHRGMGGAARLRNFPNAYGFITKKFPDNQPASFYTIKEYKTVFEEELSKLIIVIVANPERRFLISKLGGGLANKHKIFENVVRGGMLSLVKYKNVEFLY